MARRRPSSVSGRKRPQLTDDEWLYLFDRTPANPFLKHFLGNEERWAALWEQGRARVLEWWVVHRPGTRPSTWWANDAPRWDDPYGDCWYHGTMAKPRRRLGGKGTPVFECLAYGPAFRRGIPKQFVTAWELEYYGGLKNHDYPDQMVEAFDPEDPPCYESEAAYLTRHELLEEGEEQRIPEKNWAPVPRVEATSR